MKKLAFFLLVLLLLSGCGGENNSRKYTDPASLPYLTRFASFVPCEDVDFVHFYDYLDGNFIASRYALPTGTDDLLPPVSTFILNKDSKIFTELALFEDSICFDGEYYYYYGIVGGKGSHLFRSADFKTDEPVMRTGGSGMVNHSLSHSGGYIINPANAPNYFSVKYYDIESGKSFSAERRTVIDETVDIQSCNGCYAYVERRDEGLYLMGIDPAAPDDIISSCSSPVGKVFSAAFDGRTFVWQTADGIYCCEKGGEPTTVFEGETTGFSFISGRTIIYGDAKRKITFFYDIPTAFAGEHIFELYNFAYSNYDENTAVLIPTSEYAPSGYVVLEMLNIDYGEEVRWSVPYSLKVDGKTYYCYLERADIEPTEDQISGYISTVIYDSATMPSLDDQANIGCAGMPYAFVDKNLYLYTSNNSGYAYFTNWYKCEHADHID
ncbi:MAG: hypothetical protein IJO01_06925 [Oscillospiraceae bacterium]|nr:hypothetical protein [Oscillospiraceae bacterium]